MSQNPPPSTEQALRELVPVAREAKERIGCGCGGDYGLCSTCSTIWDNLDLTITAAEAALAAKEKQEQAEHKMVCCAKCNQQMPAKFFILHDCRYYYL